MNFPASLNIKRAVGQILSSLRGLFGPLNFPVKMQVILVEFSRLHQFFDFFNGDVASSQVNETVTLQLH
jgi:hypothetical protein